MNHATVEKTMASLQIRNLPDDLYQKLKDSAARERRSLTQEAIVALERGVALQGTAGIPADVDNRARRQAVLDRIKELPPLGDTSQWPSPADLIRADRDDPNR